MQVAHASIPARSVLRMRVNAALVVGATTGNPCGIGVDACLLGRHRHVGATVVHRQGRSTLNT